jgi:CRP/FNR family cyclic AMP-dependent transcriptional regulator
MRSPYSIISIRSVDAILPQSLREECQAVDKGRSGITIAGMDDADRLVLTSDSWFASLPRAHRDALCMAGNVVRHDDGAAIYWSGDPPNGMWAVLAGEVRLKGHLTPGNEWLALTLSPGGWFGEVSTIDGGPRPHDAVAYGPTTLYHVSDKDFARLTTRFPLIFRDVARLVCRHERMAIDYITQAFALSKRARLARLLLTLTGDGKQHLTLRQEDLAAMLGVSRQTLNGHLAALTNARSIERYYGGVSIIDRHVLRRMGDVLDDQ